MSLPGDLTTSVVVGTYVDSAGVPQAGRITFTPSTILADVTGSVVIPPVTRSYTISAQGTFTTDPLVATDCATISPQGWQYEVVLSIAGLQPQSWNILLPASGSPADISGITPVVPQAAVTSYLPVSGGTVAGTLTIAGGLQIPSGASDGDVLTSDPSGNASWGPITAAEIPAAASGAIGGVELNTDLGGTASAPQVVSTHLASALPLAQGGTGSAIQNFAAVFNVKGYGAAGDGSTPDDTAIQAAISAAVSAGGGVVWLPKGAYKLTTGLTMHSSVTIRGAGALVATLRPASGVTAITATGSSGSQITQTVYEDFGIVGPGQGTGSAPGMSLTWCTTGTRLSRLYIELCGTDGINAVNCYTVSVRDCFLASNGGSGLNAQTSINSWAMTGNTALSNTQWGYYIMGGAAGILHACDAESNGYGGTALLGTFSYTIEGGEHENNGSSGSGQKCGIYLGTGTGAYGVANNTTVRGNWLQGTSVALYGIVADGATGTVIEGNGFQNNTTNHINVTASATATVIRSGNYLSVPSGGNVRRRGDRHAAAGLRQHQCGDAVLRAVVRHHHGIAGCHLHPRRGRKDAAVGELLDRADPEGKQLLGQHHAAQPVPVGLRGDRPRGRHRLLGAVVPAVGSHRGRDHQVGLRVSAGGHDTVPLGGRGSRCRERDRCHRPHRGDRCLPLCRRHGVRCAGKRNVRRR